MLSSELSAPVRKAGVFSLVVHSNAAGGADLTAGARFRPLQFPSRAAEFRHRPSRPNESCLVLFRCNTARPLHWWGVQPTSCFATGRNAGQISTNFCVFN
jgi:hypothetical protein